MILTFEMRVKTTYEFVPEDKGGDVMCVYPRPLHCDSLLPPGVARFEIHKHSLIVG